MLLLSGAAFNSMGFSREDDGVWETLSKLHGSSIHRFSLASKSSGDKTGHLY